MTEETNENVIVQTPPNHQVFWNNFIKMMDKQKSVTLVWDPTNKSFTKVLSSAIKGSEKV